MSAALRKSRPKPFRLTEPPPTREHPLHRQIASLLALELAPAGRVTIDGVCWWSVDLASYLGGMPYSHIARGCIPGISDIFLLHQGRSHFFEVKAQDGEMSWPQRTLAAAVIGAGGRVAVVRNAADVIRCLDTWSVPRARRTAL